MGVWFFTLKTCCRNVVSLRNLWINSPIFCKSFNFGTFYRMMGMKRLNSHEFYSFLIAIPWKRVGYPHIRLWKVFARRWQGRIDWHRRTLRTADFRFPQATIRGFPVAKLALDDSECVLHLTAYRGLSALNKPFPVNCFVRCMRQFSGTAVNAVVYAG